MGLTISSISSFSQGLSLSATKSSYPGGWEISCHGLSDGSINLSVSGGATPYTFLWSNSATTEDLSGLSAGTYSVVVTDSLGATDSLSVLLKEPNLLASSLSTGNHNGYSLSCHNGADGYVSNTVSGGTPSYSYAWSNSSTTQGLEGIPAGNYTVTITDANNCSVSANISVTQPSAISSTLSSPTNSYGFNVSCDGKDGAINCSVSGGVPGYTFDWSSGQISQNISGLKVGTYSVNIADSNGCGRIDTITLTTPPLFTSVKDSITVYPNHENVSCDTCNDGVITAVPLNGATPYTYLWETGQTTQGITGCIPQTPYSVAITDHNGCKNGLDKVYFLLPKTIYWKTNGNSGSQAVLGTLDTIDLKIKTNAFERIRVTQGGNVGIGITNPTEKLEVLGNVKITGALTVDSIANTLMTFTSIRTGRIMALQGDSIIAIGDSSVHIGPYNIFVPSNYGSRGLGIGSTSVAFGQNSLAIGGEKARTNAAGAISMGSIVTSTAQSAITIGRGYGTATFLNNTISNSLMVGFNSTVPTLFVGPSPGTTDATSGKVGIGTSSPSQKLEVAHNDDVGGIALNRIATTPRRSEIQFNQNGTQKWELGNDISNDGHQNFFIYDKENEVTRFYIDPQGRIGIGMIPPTSWNGSIYYKLYVADGIATRDVKVTSNAWPDYVFGKSYQLTPIAQFDSAVKAIGHLPNFPSANEVEKNGGFELGAMDVKIVKQLEEQSLYIIDLQKQLDALKLEIANLKKTK